MNSREKKISLPEIIIMGTIVIGAYLLGLVCDLSAPIPVLGQIMIAFGWVVDFLVMAITQIWLIMKGGIGFSKQVTVFAGNLAEFIPFLNMLPIDVFTFFLAVYLINHPKIAEVVQNPTKAVAVAGKVAKNPKEAVKAVKGSLGTEGASLEQEGRAEQLSEEYA